MAVEVRDPSGKSEIGHTHQDVSGGSLRAAVFGAMDGLVTNISLVAGVAAAGAGSSVIVVTGVAGLVAGAFSMGLGEYASVQTQNEQVDKEWETERREIAENPEAELRELAHMFEEMGMAADTALRAATEVHQDPERATLLHVTNELGIDPREKPSPNVAAVSSFVMFSIGALVPLLPYLMGFDSLTASLGIGGVGLALAGAVASYFTSTHWAMGALRQLGFGVVAAGATYAVGLLLGVGAVG